MKRKVGILIAVFALWFGIVAAAAAATQDSDVTRATLDNGLRVVIVRDTLAPVATMEMNYLVGSDESPQGFPGTAHAVEHMMFRGSPGLSSAQLTAIGADMGGGFDARTTEGVTQYYFTVPAQDLDVALHVAAIRMRGADMSEAGWDKERGAIEQEVKGDLSNPIFKFATELMSRAFTGTPYAYSTLGTRPSFDKTTASMLKAFHDAWYAPNNAILVIAGNVDPAATLQQVKSLFGDIPRKTLPTRPAFNPRPLQPQTIKLTTDLPVGITALAWRFPGQRSKDYAAALVLAKAMNSPRGDLHVMPLLGKALVGGFSSAFMPHASLGFAIAGFRRGGDSARVLKNLETVIAQTALNGIPDDLIKAAKRELIADQEYEKNSVPGLANAWSGSLASLHYQAPADLSTAVAAVTPAEVNALARRIFVPAHAITAILTPQSSGKVIAHKGFGGPEHFGGKPGGAVTLPDWAQATFAKLVMPIFTTHPSDFTLANGLRLIVQPESVSKTVEVFGEVRTNQDMQAPKGKEGVATVLNDLFSFGTTDMDRLQFQAALEAIDAHEKAGSSFSLAVPSANFAKGMQLLADNELHPGLPDIAFAAAQNQLEANLKGLLQSPGFLFDIQFDRALYPAGDPALRHATPESVASLTPQDLQAYYRQTFRPDMTSIVIVGDVTPDEARKVVTATFGEWKASGTKSDPGYPTVPMNKPSQFHVPDSSAVQASVTLAENIAMNQDSPDRFPMDLGNLILGGGLNSILMQDLRGKDGLVYDVRSGVRLMKHRSDFSIRFGCDPDKVAKARTLAIRDVEEMRDAPVSAAELHDAKGKMLRVLTLRQSSFSSIAHVLLVHAEAGMPLDSDALAAGKFMAVTAPEIQAAFERYVRPDDFITAIRGPASQH